jgi:hypothetical protein
MRGVYTAKVKVVGLNAAKTLIYLTAPADKVLEIISAAVTNASNETNEQLECCLQRIGTLGTPTATTLTPSKAEPGDQASGSTAKGNVTAGEPTYTADTEWGYEGAPSLGGWRYDPVPEEREVINGGGSVGLRVLAAPLAFDAVASITYREIG